MLLNINIYIYICSLTQTKEISLKDVMKSESHEYQSFK